MAYYKKLTFIFLLSFIPFFVLAEDDAEVEKQIETSVQDKMTIREAKSICKSAGKKGKELIVCIKEKIKK